MLEAARFITNASGATAQCPGTFLAPQAAAGLGADRFGAIVVAPNAEPGVFGSSGNWAVTLL